MSKLKLLVLIPLFLFLSGCPYPYISSQSSEDPSRLSQRFNQDYQPLNNHRILLFAPSYSYVDLFMVGGTLQDGPSPSITMSSRKISKVTELNIEQNKIACFYIKPGKYDFLFENKYISPKKIEKTILINQPINIINLHASGLYGAAKLSIKQVSLSDALPIIYGEWTKREKCLLLE